jgi:ubiquitin-hydrolase Zn-finger-containing protein
LHPLEDLCFAGSDYKLDLGDASIHPCLVTKTCASSTAIAERCVLGSEPGVIGCGSSTADSARRQGETMAEPVVGIDPTVLPSGPGCTKCEETGGWWFHLRRCAQCGHIGCCDSSPSQHASAHAAATGHPIIRSYEPGEDWFWDYRRERVLLGPPLAPPEHDPLDQPVPGPAGGVPPDWQDQLH